MKKILNHRIISVQFLFLSYILLVLFLSLFTFLKERREAYSNLDSTLYASAYSLDLILGKDFHDKYTKSSPVSRQKYSEIKTTLNEYVKSMKVEYVYSMIQKNKNVYFVVSNETQEDIERGTPSLFYNPYPKPPKALKKTFESGERTYYYYYSYTNIWDSYYSIFLPRVSPEGKRYILAADVKLENQRALLKKSFYESAFIILILLLPLIPVHIFLKRLARKKDQEVIEQLSTDVLTGLPNRARFLEEIDRNPTLLKSIIVINIDSFHEINNTFGSAVADKVLILVSTIIKNHCPGKCSVFKFPVDEFLLLTEEASIEEIRALTLTILQAIASESFFGITQPLNLTARAGIAYQTEENKLLRHANMAVNHAKVNSLSYVIYDEPLDLEEKQSTNFYWLAKLKEALRKEKIVPFYQPIFNNVSGKVEKYEALVRLIDSDGTIITPDKFLDIAKKSKLYKEVTHSMISQALSDFSKTNYKVALNLSTQDFTNIETVNFLIESIERFSMQGRVTLELVESESVTKYEMIIPLIQELSNHGFQIAIDDFGSGYSNFEYLTRFNINFLKIDGSIVRTILEKKTSDALVSAIASFAQKLNISLIAEYVSNDKIFQRINEHQIGYSQGYYIGQPVAFADLKL